MNDKPTRKLGKIILGLIVIIAVLLMTACGGGDGDGDSDGDNGGDASVEVEESVELDADELAEAQPEDILSEAPDADELYTNVANTTDGETLYNTLCSKCHGLTGLGDGPSIGSVNITGNFILTTLQEQSDEELMETITYGKGIDMPAWGLILSLEQREAVLDYVRTLGEA